MRARSSKFEERRAERAAKRATTCFVPDDAPPPSGRADEEYARPQRTECHGRPLFTPEGWTNVGECESCGMRYVRRSSTARPRLDSKSIWTEPEHHEKQKRKT